MVSFTNIKLMKKIILCLFVFFISCSSTTESETPTTKEEILPESNVTLPTSETHDHDDEGQVYFDEVIVPESAPESLQILTYNLSDKAVLYFISTVETEVHVHGYDIHFMVYQDKENKLSIWSRNPMPVLILYFPFPSKLTTTEMLVSFVFLVIFAFLFIN